MVMKANFNIYKQCPQLYVYIFSVAVALLLSLKRQKLKESAFVLLSGVITTVMLMGINFCDWYFQWYTWFLAIIFLMTATMDAVAIFHEDKQE